MKQGEQLSVVWGTWVSSADRTLGAEAWRREFERVQGDSVAESRRRTRVVLMQRAPLVADVCGLLVAFALTVALVGLPWQHDALGLGGELLVFLLTIPIWLVVAGFHGLCGRDVERMDHTTVNELLRVVQTVTIGAWTALLIMWVAGASTLEVKNLVIFWGLAVTLVAASRALACTLARRSGTYVERTLVLGAGDVGQLIARKIRLHPKYGLRLVRFLDSDPRAPRSDIGGVAALGGFDQLEEVVHDLQVERVIVAFSREPDEATMRTLRGMRDRSVVVDVVIN